MSQENIKAKKKFGQNFLNNKTIINKIINIIKPEDKNIIEIGPGTGALTKEIINKCNTFIAFEIDKDMIDYLNNLNIFNGTTKKLEFNDFLKCDLSEYSNYEIVGNIPYYITTDIIFKIIENRHLFKQAILMVQNEVADRIIAMPNSENYSKLSITCQYVAEVKKELFIGKGNFSPIPKVDSAIISFKFYNNINDKYDELKEFFKLCFLARRKKLIWSLLKKYNKNDILVAFSKLEINENIRIQQLELSKIIELFNLLKTL